MPLGGRRRSLLTTGRGAGTDVPRVATPSLGTQVYLGLCACTGGAKPLPLPRRLFGAGLALAWPCWAGVSVGSSSCDQATSTVCLPEARRVGAARRRTGSFAVAAQGGAPQLWGVTFENSS